MKPSFTQHSITKCYIITCVPPRPEMMSVAVGRSALGDGFEAPEGPFLAHSLDQPGHLRAALAPSERDPQRVEELAPFLSGDLFQFVRQRTPGFPRPVQFFGGGGGLFHEEALLVAKLGRIDIAANDSEPIGKVAEAFEVRSK